MSARGPGTREHGGPDALWSHLEWRAGEHPDRVFVVAESPDGERREMDYGAVHREAEMMATIWSSLGVGSGSRVHVQLGNVPDFVVSLFAAARLGAVLVPTDPSATVDDVVYVTSHSGCVLSVVARQRADVVVSAAEMVHELAHVIAIDGTARGALDLTVLRSQAPAGAPAPAQVRSDDLAAVLYTSGTTGWPKGVMLTHANLLFAGRAVAELVRLRPDDRWLVTLPLSHANALHYSMMSAFVTGASVALVGRFDAADWSAAAHRTAPRPPWPVSLRCTPGSCSRCLPIAPTRPRICGLPCSPSISPPRSAPSWTAGFTPTGSRCTASPRRSPRASAIRCTVPSARTQSDDPPHGSRRVWSTPEATMFPPALQESSRSTASSGTL